MTEFRTVKRNGNRLDYNRPALRSRIVEDIRFVSGGKRND